MGQTVTRLERVLVTGGSGFIGTNYVDLALKKGRLVRNLDRRPPRKAAHLRYWTECDLLDAAALRTAVAEYRPTHVVHLAAKTGVRGSLDEFSANPKALENLLNALTACETVQRLVVASSTLVCRIGYVPECDTDYCPTTGYGRSKVEVERVLRAAAPHDLSWIIVRPVSIWGPWGEEPYRDLFNAINKGWYLHVGDGDVKKSLGYVENVAWQLDALLRAPAAAVDEKVVYIADDPPIALGQFAETIRSTLGAPPIRKVPIWLARILARCGDVLQVLGLERVPLTTFRLRNILTEYVYDTTLITSVTVGPPYSVAVGVERTAQWLRAHEWAKEA